MKTKSFSWFRDFAAFVFMKREGLAARL